MKCGGYHCKSGMPGVWQPIILLWAENHPPMTHQPAELKLNDILVCPECKDRAKPIHFIDEISWAKIKKAFRTQGKTMPSFKTAAITFFIPDSLDIGGYKV